MENLGEVYFLNSFQEQESGDFENSCAEDPNQSHELIPSPFAAISVKSFLPPLDSRSIRKLYTPGVQKPRERAFIVF